MRIELDSWARENWALDSGRLALEHLTLQRLFETASQARIWTMQPAAFLVARRRVAMLVVPSIMVMPAIVLVPAR